MKSLILQMVLGIIDIAYLSIRLFIPGLISASFWVDFIAVLYIVCVLILLAFAAHVDKWSI